MKKIDRHIIKKFVKSVLLALFAIIGIFVLSQIFKVIAYVTSGRLTPIQGGEYMLALIPEIVVQVAPLACLLGGLMTINKMASNLEVIALKTSGISFRRIILFPILFTFIMSLGVFYLNNDVKPRGLQLARELKRRNEIKDEEIPVSKTNVYSRGDGNYIYYFGYVNRENNSARNVEIVILNNDFSSIKSIVTAKTATYGKSGSWELKNANENIIDGKTTVFHDTYKNPILKEKPEIFLTPKYKKDELTLGQLRKVMELLRKTGGESREFEVEFHQRLASPFSCIFLGLLGLALGSRYVRGSSALNIALSIAFGYGYYIVQSSFEAVALGGILSPVLGAWIPNLIYLIIGIIAINKAEY